MYANFNYVLEKVKGLELTDMTDTKTATQTHLKKAKDTKGIFWICE